MKEYKIRYLTKYITSFRGVLIILISRDFLISLLYILRDYLVVIYLIKYILKVLLRLSCYKETLHYIFIIDIVELE